VLLACLYFSSSEQKFMS